MAKFPVYEQTTRPSGPRADAEAFGAGTGRGMQQVAQGAGELAQMQMKLQKAQQDRTDFISKRVGATAAGMEIQDIISTADETPDGYLNPRTVDGYIQNIQQIGEKHVSEFQGSETARQNFKLDMGDLIAEKVQHVRKKAVSAQYKAIDQDRKERSSQFANAAAVAPELIGPTVEPGGSIDRYLDEMGDAVPPTVKEAYRDEMVAETIYSAALTAANEENYDLANKIMADYGGQEVMSRQQFMQVRTKVIVGQRQDEKAEQELDIFLRKAQIQAGVDIETTRIKESLKAQNRKWSDLNPMEQIGYINVDRQTRGLPPLTPDEEAKYLKVYVDDKTTKDNLFGGGLSGKAEQHLVELGPLVATGNATDDQIRIFESSMNISAGGYIDPNSGLRVPGRVPEHARQAAQAAGIPVPGEGSGAEQQGGEGVDENLPTLWEESGKLAGPLDVAAAWMGGVSVVGDVLEMTGVDTASRRIAVKRAQEMERDLVRLLQNNPRYSETERQAIAKEIKLTGSILSRDPGYRSDLVGIDDGLRRRYNDALQMLSEDDLTKEMRSWAMNAIAQIPRFRRRLGIPPRVNSQDDYNKLPVGSEYIDSNGKSAVKRQEVQK